MKPNGAMHVAEGHNLLSDDIENDILHRVKMIADYMWRLGFDMTERRCFDWVAACRTRRFPAL
jgi:hypothetical protein